MKSYIAYKNQLRGIQDVLETVKTVEKIAASSIHSLKQEVLNLHTYAVEIEETLTRLSPFYRKRDHPLLQKKGAGGENILVILTGDRGLVGGLWHEIVNTFSENTTQYKSAIIVGTKGEHYLKEERIPTIKSFTDMSTILQEEEAERITNYVFNEFKKGTFSKVDILYPQYISLAEQAANFIPFLPFEFELAKERKNGEGLPIFESSKRKIFDRLLQKYIRVFFRKVVAETTLSELSARTVAMEHAATKTEELIRKLALHYAKERRRIITQRQIESFAAHVAI